LRVFLSGLFFKSACGAKKLAYICTRFGKQTGLPGGFERRVPKGFAGKTGIKEVLKKTLGYPKTKGLLCSRFRATVHRHFETQPARAFWPGPVTWGAGLRRKKRLEKKPKSFAKDKKLPNFAAPNNRKGFPGRFERGPREEKHWKDKQGPRWELRPVFAKKNTFIEEIEKVER
jgi:hypothetical protein